MLKITAYAKVNLFLEITGKLANSYHTVDTVMQSVSVSDSIELEFVPRIQGISLTVNDSTVPIDDRNIAYKAAKKYIEAVDLDCGVHINLIKNIPTEAGMGGGSADGASVLVGLNRMNNNYLNDDKLTHIASTIGADVPFCIAGGTQRLSGIGTELVEKLETPSLHLVIAKPHTGISTSEAYKCLDLLHHDFLNHSPADSGMLLYSVRNKCSSGIANYMFNRFEEACDLLCPATSELIAFMKDNSHGALLSGSGAAVFAIVESNNEANILINKIKYKFPDYYVSEAHTVSSGCIINN